MKQLAFFALEGRLRQGPHEVWITLGRFNSAQSAHLAIHDPATVKSGIVETRIVPLYRVSDPPTRARRFNRSEASVHDSVTVA